MPPGSFESYSRFAINVLCQNTVTCNVAACQFSLKSHFNFLSQKIISCCSNVLIISIKLWCHFYLLSAGKAGQNIFNFHFRGCGWKKKTVNWDEDKQVWVKVLNQLLTLMFGKEFFVYEYNEKKVCMVADDSRPTFKYNAEQWNEEYSNMITEGTTINAEGSYCTLYCYEALLHVTISEGPRAAVGISTLSLLLFLSLTSAFSQELSCCFTRVVLSLVIIHLLHVVVSELCCLSELTLTGLVLNPL